MTNANTDALDTPVKGTGRRRRGPFAEVIFRLSRNPHNDTGVLIKGEERNIGKDICDEFKDEKALKFIFTDEKTAREGTRRNQ